MPEEVAHPPPTPKIMDYPATFGVAIAIVMTAALLFIASRFDPTHGSLTISLMVVLAFIGVVVFCMFFTVPQDTTTAAVVGGLVAAFGAVISYWLTPKNRE